MIDDTDATVLSFGLLTTLLKMESKYFKSRFVEFFIR